MENLIEELTKVNPSNLSEEGLKLFNKINEIIDRNKELEEENETKLEIFELGKESSRKRIEYDYIPKTLIKEKIEELKPINFNNADDRDYIIRILQDLLK